MVRFIAKHTNICIYNAEIYSKLCTCMYVRVYVRGVGQNPSRTKPPRTKPTRTKPLWDKPPFGQNTLI